MGKLTLDSVSKHLTVDVISQAFQAKTNSEDSPTAVQVARAASAGEGLLAAVHRLTVRGTHHTASFVVKAMVKDPLLKKSLLGNEKYFQREIYFFSTLLPALIEVQRDMGATETIQNNIPICYGFYCDGSDDFILMEDLAERNLSSHPETPTKVEKNANLKALAHFHAVSMAMQYKKPNKFSKLIGQLTETYYNEDNRVWYSKYMQNAIIVFKAALAEVEGPSSDYYQKFLEFLNKDPYQQLIAILSQRGKNLALCHGDAWCSNFLSLDDLAVAFDFQLVRCSSVVTDVVYLLTMCNNLNPDKESMRAALKYYYDCLVHYLKDMGINGNQYYDWNQFNDDLKQYGKFGLLASLTSIPLISSKRCDNLGTFEEKYKGFSSIPLEELWPLTPIEDPEKKMMVQNAVRTAVDLGFI